MDIEGWRVFAWLTLLVFVYGVLVAATGTPATIWGFLVVVVFGGIGLLLGRRLSERVG